MAPRKRDDEPTGRLDPGAMMYNDLKTLSSSVIGMGSQVAVLASELKTQSESINKIAGEVSTTGKEVSALTVTTQLQQKQIDEIGTKVTGAFKEINRHKEAEISRKKTPQHGYKKDIIATDTKKQFNPFDLLQGKMLIWFMLGSITIAGLIVDYLNLNLFN